MTMARKRNETAKFIDNSLHQGDRPTAESVGVEGNGEENPSIPIGGNGEGTAETGKLSAPRNRTDSEYWLVATDPMDGACEFLLNAPTVGQGRKLRIRMMGTPMARGRKIRLARVTYVEG